MLYVTESDCHRDRSTTTAIGVSGLQRAEYARLESRSTQLQSEVSEWIAVCARFTTAVGSTQLQSGVSGLLDSRRVPGIDRSTQLQVGGE